MNREERRKQGIKSNKDKDTMNLERISSSISNKVKNRLRELRASDDKFSSLNHVQLNYFNIQKLGLKYQASVRLKGKEKEKRPVGMSYADAVIKNTQTGEGQPEYYLCINILFDEDNMDVDKYQMLLGLTSKVHNWTYSDKDNIYIDELGVYIDRVEIEKEKDNKIIKEVDSNGNKGH